MIGQELDLMEVGFGLDQDLDLPGAGSELKEIDLDWIWFKYDGVPVRVWSWFLTCGCQQAGSVQIHCEHYSSQALCISRVPPQGKFSRSFSKAETQTHYSVWFLKTWVCLLFKNLKQWKVECFIIAQGRPCVSLDVQAECCRVNIF